MREIFTKLVFVITTLLFLSCVNEITTDKDDEDSDNDDPVVENPTKDYDPATITVNFE